MPEPIPKNAKCVFKGKIFDVYQWQQKMFDGGKVTFEKIRRQDTVVIIATVDEKIVMLKQRQPRSKWFIDLPSGRMDKRGESSLRAAARELAEETGLASNKWRLWKTYQPSGKVVHKVFYFIANDCRQTTKQKLDSGEQIKVSYVSFDEFLKLTDNPAAMFGPLTVDLLLARIHKQNREYLKKTIFQPKAKIASPKFGPTTNW